MNTAETQYLACIYKRKLVEWFGGIPNPREIAPLEPTAFAKMQDWLELQTADPAKQHPTTLNHSLLHQAFTREL